MRCVGTSEARISTCTFGRSSSESALGLPPVRPQARASWRWKWYQGFQAFELDALTGSQPAPPSPESHALALSGGETAGLFGAAGSVNNPVL